MAVSRADKDAELAELETAFRQADTAVLVEYRGISVPQVTELRRQIRAAGARYRVVKNSLALRALKDTPLEPLGGKFENTTGVAYTGNDPVALARTLVDFAKFDAAGPNLR